MLNSDVRLLTPARLAVMTKFYGLTQRGKKGIWVCQKSVTDPRTRTERTFKRSTKTTDQRTALHRAASWINEFMAQIHGGELPTLSKTGGWASLEQISAHYKRAASCNLDTRRRNINHLENMLAMMYPDYEYNTLSSEIIDGRLVRQWQLLRKERIEKDYLPHNLERAEQAKRAVNAAYRQARSVFSAAMMRSYEDAGLKLPAGCREFAQQRFLAAAAPPPSEQLPPEVVSKIVRLMPRLRQVRPGVWACLLLMFRAGLRNSEAMKARWSWIYPTTTGGYVIRLHTQADYKPKAKERKVALSPDLVELLKTVRPAGDAADSHVVPAPNDNQRQIACYRGVNKFLRACGVRAVKGKFAYRLRGHAITEIMLAHGMDAAQGFAGHASRATTELYKGTDVPYLPLQLPVSAEAKVVSLPR